MKRYYRSPDMPLLPSEKNTKSAILETKQLIKIIDKRKKKAKKKLKKTTFGGPTPKKMAEFKAMSYKNYLRSNYWKRVKRLIQKKYKFTCQICGGHSSLEVHHKRYVTRGTEHKDLSCLTLLCGLCHMETHEIDTSSYEPWGGVFKEK